ncbi:SPP1 family predicted phage head-tail adaptor [Micromonospora sp. Llam0]|uniref:phage head closure protein n=1 Tax=Micromonospora sp. Llam0 TaxID=2485143 RepID=UPI000FA0274E|nr:phage head closure protein [Micromonospora sp. Llam0]ROO51459.1 SPP1 family predicted phage head-tail adaptor [Micromonospora sp. Llam0]
MIPIGTHDLPRQLTVWRPQLVDDGAGGQTVTHVQVGAVWARVPQPSTAERVAAAQAGAAHTTPLYLRPDADVARGDELRGGGEVWRVTSTVVPSEPAYLRADCKWVQSEPPSEETS